MVCTLIDHKNDVKKIVVDLCWAWIQNTEKCPKNLSGNSPKMSINPNFAYKNLAICSRNPDLPQFFSEIMT